MKSRWGSEIQRVFGLSLLLVANSPAQQAGPEQAPLRVDKVEKISVRLVTLDVLVVDHDNTTVQGLKRDDFRLTVDGKDTQIDTVDEYCLAGAQDEPQSTRKEGGWREAPDLSEGTRKIAFVFDYLHLSTSNLYHTKALESLHDVLGQKEVADEEQMVVALTGSVRIEQPLTRDRKEVIRTLEKMEYDVTLFAGHFEHQSEKPFFEGMKAIIIVLSQVPGPKALVLFTAGDGPGIRYDRNFHELATLAAEARVSIYPVDARGLFPTPFT